ncbi:hypothetical protein CAEBREN_09997 [Caenorhabditis brenneri]|uniref:Follistatin-like domain-containing protein n=1 Tax=Caenorhabditis brenneri TaxID=135651 RepID=G0P062_CAEBE|nr:hypothetical protein CAEBREN_09997 [Caenorhabditis brenneri]
MMKAAVLLLLVVAAAQAQLSSTRDEDCKDNETFQTCGSACEPSCDAPSPGFCTLQCVVGCQCDKGFFRRSDNACVTKDQCTVTTNTTAPVAPILPAILPAPSNLTCGANEEANECHNPCTEKKCPVANPPMVNCLLACMNGCSCKKGYLRNMQGQCVKDADCPPVDNTENQCNLVDCRTGTKCVIQSGKPACIPVSNTPKPPLLTCATVLCAPGHVCKMVNNRPNCVKSTVPEEPHPTITCANVRCGSKGGCGMVEPTGCPGCKLQPHCLEVNNCNTANCSSTEECVLVQVTCVMAPCHPIAECRPKKNIKPLVQIREPRQTGASCMTARCATPAGCAMIRPMSCGNKKRCELRPACIHENACAATSCLVGSTCVLQEVQCIRAPCNPIAKCERIRDERCSKDNETYKDCKTACSDTQCNSEPRMCPQVCRGGGCVCLPGFFRDKQKKISDYSDTPAPTIHDNNSTDINIQITPCSTVRCAAGTECQELYRNCSKPPCELYASCVNSTTLLDDITGGCATMRCGAGQICQEAMVKCAKAPCPRHGMCVEDVTSQNDTVSSCASVTCPIGESCEETEVQCFVAPCPKLVSCVQIPQPQPPVSPPIYTTNRTMVGCDIVRCPEGKNCKETPINCTNPPCAPNVTCVPDPNYYNTIPFVRCDTVECPSGGTCQQYETNCTYKPCLPRVICDLGSHTMELSCENVKCPRPGDVCATEGGSNFVAYKCVPWDIYNTLSVKGCSMVKCPAGEICEESLVNCTKPPCLPYVSCVPDPRQRPPVVGCESVKCPTGEICEESMVDCVNPPCPKAVSCIPMNANQNSTAQHGCDVVKCRANEVCEEQTVNCLMAPCPVQVACVSIIHTNGTAPSTNTTGSVCPKNQTMSDCLNTCSEDKCPGGETNMMCTKHCGQGCACLPGYVRSSDGECYKSKDCPPEQMCGVNEEYRCEKCAGTCKNPEPNCPGPKNKNCNKKCICAPGFIKKNGKCVTLASCPDHDHSNITCLGTQDFTDCLPKCRQLCSGVTECDTNMHTEMCTPGCVCRPNYKLDSNGDCVHNRHCFKTTDCPDNEEWSKCVSDDNICNMATIQKVPLRDRCFSGCICAVGFARNSNGTCVEQDKC